MKKRLFTTLILAFLILSMPLFFASPRSLAAEQADLASLVNDKSGITHSYKNYSQFLAENAAVAMARQEITLSLADLKNGEGTFLVFGDQVEIEEDGSLTVKVTVPETALYELQLTYMAKPGRSAPCELTVLVNDDIQYRQAAAILADRIWKDANETIEVDDHGNDIRPAVVEVAEYATRRCMDSSGYNTRPLLFKMDKGVNRLTILENRESILIKEIKLCPRETIPSYAEYQSLHEGIPIATQSAPRIQAEKTTWKNDPILVPTTDRTSPLTEPYKGAKISLNTIGQDGWSISGQTIAWSVDVPVDGLYEIRFKIKQNYIRGTYSSRTLLIDGQVPFAEAENIRFTFDSRWQLVALGNGSTPYLVHLTPGRHELSLRVTLGDLSDIIGRVDSCTIQINEIYRKFLMIMGSTPDTMRDYKLERQLPDLFLEMDDLADRLETIASEMRSITGTQGTELLSLTRMAMTLRDFVEKPYEIPSKFAVFTSHMSSLNAWKNDAAYRPLEIDYIDVIVPGKPVEQINATFWQSIKHSLSLFLSSFTVDYDNLGSTSDASQSITVWSTTGRDQAQVLNQLVKSYFSTKNDISVEIQLVKIDAILPSTVAGNGPDLVLYAPQQMPVNFAIRGAAYDLSKFDGFSDVITNFRTSALVPASFNNGVYGLPEIETFPMLFYRKDILDEIGVPIPNSWPEVIRIIPDLQKNNMSLLLETGLGNTVDNTIGLSTYAMLLYQNGGAFYEGDGVRTLLDTKIAIETFQNWCKLYTNYGLPTNFNTAYRFRTGESPLVIADMSLYNTLMISAPEIKGLWGLTTVPGTPQGDIINKSVKSNTTYTMIMSTCENTKAAWRFIQWWLSEDIQLAYARDLESLMGAAARYMTANVNAFARLPWSTKDFKSILEQSRWTIGVPEVPGGYFLPRHINNAFRSVVINKADPRETLISYAKVINDELSEKRLEFGLPTLGTE